ncbi:MAG: hypothetical protein ACYS3N_09420 [Planctomycetota bacterium]|jgi:hypothetical protein
MNYRSTREVERLLNINNLGIKIHRRQVDAPEKGPTGAYMWTPEDIDRCSWQTRHCSADDVLPELRTVTG